MTPAITHARPVVLFFLLTYLAGIFYLTRRIRSTTTKEGYFLASRGLSSWRGSLSLAASWLWAPGLFISAQQAHDNGLSALFWFMIGNVTTLAIFGWFMDSLRKREPAGFTLPGHLKHRYSVRIQRLYAAEMALLAVAAFAVNLLACALALSALIGASRFTVVMTLGALSLIYTSRKGLRAAVASEIAKFVTVWASLLLTVPWAIYRAGGLSTIRRGLGGTSHSGIALLGSSHSNHVFITFGAAAALGHLAGPWGDNSFFQLTFAFRNGGVRAPFFIASAIFAVPPLLAGSLGLAGAGASIPIPRGQSDATNLYTAAATLPTIGLAIFGLAILAGLIGVLDTQLSSIALLASHDFARAETTDKRSILIGKASMIGAALLGCGICLIPGVHLFHIFLFFATLRASVWLPTMLTLWRPHIVMETALFWGIVIAAGISLPLYVWGQLTSHTGATLIATGIATLTPILVIVMAWLNSLRASNVTIVA